MKKRSAIVLGAGMVGHAIALDLCDDYDVLAVDNDPFALHKLRKRSNVKTKTADLSVAKIVRELVQKFDIVIGAVPGFMGYKTVKAVVEAGKNIVDISFFPEDPFHLNRAAQQKKVTAVVDCGVAPGFSHIIVGYHHQKMMIKNFECFVGGLPKERVQPFEYKAPFSPADVIEEYTRPARVIENGVEVIKEPLSEVEQLDFKNVGILEAFNSDGLRTLTQTVDIPFMKEKTLRYPGHARKMKLLRDAGFFSKNPVEVDGKKITPLDFTSQLLFPQWKLGEREKELTVMKIVMEGIENGTEVRYEYDVYDEFDEATGISSMARTTGYTCSAAARLVLEEEYMQKGISPPEFLGARDDCFGFICDYLKNKGITIKMKRHTF